MQMCIRFQLIHKITEEAQIVQGPKCFPLKGIDQE